MSDSFRLPPRGSSSPAPPPPPPPAPVQQGHKYSNRAAIIGGKEILKTIRVSPDHLSEEFNLRNAIISYSSTHHVGSGLSARHKDQLTVRDVKWSHGTYDRIIATAVANGRIVLYDLHRTGLEYCRFQGHNRQVHRLAFNPHRPHLLLSGSQDSSIRMWDLRVPSIERGASVCGSKEHFNGNSDAIRDIRWSPSDASMFATATDSGAIQLWDIRKTSAPAMRITAHDRPCFSVDWHPDGKHIISGGTDRQVKVWDFSSSAERRQKPTFQFRTPQAVLNVRWRPPSWAREPESTGDWQSTQVVTSYDKEDPRIHLWDLRRPHIPFREFDRYDSHAADLLWHSKDLLWTAGDSGAFTQTDVRYAPQVVNQRPTCAVAWSPTGDVLAFVQKRPQRSTLGLSTTEFVGHQHEEDSNGGEVLSQSPADDLLDEPSFASFRHRHSKSTSSARPSKSLGGTPPGTTDFNPVLPLEQVLAKIKPPGPYQQGMTGSIPGATMSQEVFRHLARNYSPLLGAFDGVLPDSSRGFLESLTRNAESAEDAPLIKLAQTWHIIQFAAMQELEVKARERQMTAEKGLRNVTKGLSKEVPAVEKSRALEDGRQDKLKTRFFKGVLEPVGSKKQLRDAESASNMTTPLAQPLPDSPIGSSDSSASHMTSLNDFSNIQPLPPSVLSSNTDTMNSNDWYSVPDAELRPIAQLQQRRSSSDESPHSRAILGSETQVPENDQRSAPRAIAGRTDWRTQSHPDYRKGASEEDEYDQKMEDKRAAIRDYKSAPKKVLSLESPVETTKPPAFHRHESTESFPMFSASTGSSHPSKSIGTSFSSTTRLYGVSENVPDPVDGLGAETPNKGMSRARGESKLDSGLVREEDLVESEPFEEDLADSGHLHLERPSSPPIILKESSPLKTPTQELEESTLFSVPWATPAGGDDLDGPIIPTSPDGIDVKPWSAEALLKQAIRHYHSGAHVDVQTAAHLLQKLRILFRDHEKILPSEECEFVYQAYNDQLIRHSMHIEAAELRLLCVPSYPAIYEYTQADTYMNVFCFTCKRPYENPKNDNRRCYRCNTPQEPCTICMSLDPPPEWMAEHTASQSPSSPEWESEATSHLLSSQSSLRTEPIPPSELQHIDESLLGSYSPPRPKGSTLWTWCQGCGHGGHMACVGTWLNDIAASEGGCATPGCMHDCGPGPRREHNRTVLLEESKKRDTVSKKSGFGFVKRDAWSKGESKAVEKVRGMLSVGTSGGTNASSTSTAGPSGASSSNLMSPKKVRLVTPSEQGKRRSAASRASTGG
ncbi:SEA (Seh1-associated) complex subunit [Aspergillus melleus]|uniref:SEA (Seh1-associated) complex subunit n=1 Tax=Aspergillus melleus TaxID=138277 RepID=A0ACC3BA33_9EURO|nr:SEA (Seh1-associated) complex subunit [Aspergillus melleus]